MSSNTPKNEQTSRLTRRTWRLTGVALAIVLLLICVLWLATHYVPSWYRPPKLTPEDVKRARASLPNTLQSFTDRLVAGRRFKFQLAAEIVNQWIAARDDLWPDVRKRWPDQIADAVVAFEDDTIILAGRAEFSMVRAIISLHCRASVSPQFLDAQIVDIRVGAVSAPPRLIDQALSSSLDGLRHTSADWSHEMRRWIEPLFDNGFATFRKHPIRQPNVFIWPNGDREFTITDVESQEGILTLHIEPLNY